MDQNLQQALLEEIRQALEPLQGAADTEEDRLAIFHALGWEIRALGGVDVNRLISGFARAYGAVDDLLSHPPEGLSDIARALGDVGKAVEGIRTIAVAAGSGGALPVEFNQVGVELIEQLLVRHLKEHHPSLYSFLVLVTLIRDPLDMHPSELPAPVMFDGMQVRTPTASPRFTLDRFGALVKDPFGYLYNEYFPAGLTTGADADAAADKLFPRIAAFLQTVGLEALHGVPPEQAARLDWGSFGNATVPHMLSVWRRLDDLALGLDGTDPPQIGTAFGATFALSSADRGNLGLVVAPFGEVDLTFNVTEVAVQAIHSLPSSRAWTVALKFVGSADGFAIGPPGFQLLIDDGSGSVDGEFSVIKQPSVEGEPAILIGSVKGTRLEISSLRAGGEISASEKKQEYGLLIEVGSAAIVIAGDDGDGFLQRVLPPEGLRTDFDLALGWSKTRGLYFRGGAGIEVTLPVHASLAGILTVDSVYLAIRAKDADIQAIVAAAASAKLGPVTVAVERVGLQAKFVFPTEGGNLGPLQVDFAFKAPDGAGLAIDASAVFGGGYLFFNEEKEEYAGILQLEVEGIAVKAIGLLTTRMPDKSKGFSLLIIITVEGFTPIQLGFGFTLNGVGGLLGVNRTAIVDVLRAGLKSHTLDSLLFPKDPVRNAPQIVSDVGKVFMPAEGRYLFGPMAQIGWGTPTIVTIQLAVILELPQPVRLIILGQLKALLPSQEDEQKALIRLHMDALGVIDFARGEASLDATLYDSQLIKFVLTGDMALRTNWAGNPRFLLSIGGFNPRFQAPVGIPHLNRLAVSLNSGDSLRMRLEAYLAMTSNTAQFGARLDLAATAGMFSLEGQLGFDALFHFTPFQFIIDSTGYLKLKAGDEQLSIYVGMTLSGPSPWHALGKATIEVLGFKQSISFDNTFGEQIQPPRPPTIDVASKLIEALGNQGNWNAQLPGDGHMLVSLRKIPESAGLVHPLGSLAVYQRVVPLGIEITRFGTATLVGPTKFEVGPVDLNGVAPDDSEPVDDYFAMAQFLELSDNEKLSRPSFEVHTAGMRFSTARISFGCASDAAECVLVTKIEYDTIIVDPESKSSLSVTQKYAIPTDAFQGQASLAAAAVGGMGRAGKGKYRAPGKPLMLSDPDHLLVARNTLYAGSYGLDSARRSTYAMAAEAMRKYLAKYPDARGRLQIIARHEVR